eukprot:1031274-Alexandrium_andersonii.AAC.2
MASPVPPCYHSFRSASRAATLARLHLPPSANADTAGFCAGFAAAAADCWRPGNASPDSAGTLIHQRAPASTRQRDRS